MTLIVLVSTPGLSQFTDSCVFKDDCDLLISICVYFFSVAKIFPNVTFNFSGGAMLNLTPYDYLIQQSSNVISLFMFWFLLILICIVMNYSLICVLLIVSG